MNEHKISGLQKEAEVEEHLADFVTDAYYVKVFSELSYGPRSLNVLRYLNNIWTTGCAVRSASVALWPLDSLLKMLVMCEQSDLTMRIKEEVR